MDLTAHAELLVLPCGPCLLPQRDSGGGQRPPPRQVPVRNDIVVCVHPADSLAGGEPTKPVPRGALHNVPRPLQWSLLEAICTPSVRSGGVFAAVLLLELYFAA